MWFLDLITAPSKIREKKSCEKKLDKVLSHVHALKWSALIGRLGIICLLRISELVEVRRETEERQKF